MPVTIELLKHLNSKVMIEFLNPMLPDFERAILFWKVLSLRPCILTLDSNMKMNMEWDYTERGKKKYPEKNLSQCHSVHQESHGLESKPCLRGESLASNCLSHGTTYIYTRFSSHLTQKTK
jgi:hypothetical protein